MNGVWYSYLAAYNVTASHDPSIGFIKLDDISNTATGYGPWRHERPSPQTGGYGLYIPDQWARSVLEGETWHLEQRRPREVCGDRICSPANALLTGQAALRIR